MIGVALKGLAARKVRALLTAFAIVIGVAMVSGTFMLTDTMQKSFDGLFSASYDNTEAVITPKEFVEGSISGNGVTIPASLLDEVRALPEVGAAAGDVAPQETNAADIITPDGSKAARESIGGGIDSSNERFSPLKLKTGDWPVGPEQVVIDAGTAQKQDYEIGDPIVISTFGTERTFELSGTVSFGGVDSLGLASIAAWETPTAQQLLGRVGQFDDIALSAAEGTSTVELVKAVRQVLPATLQVENGEEQAADASEELNKSMDMIRVFLLGFAGIALLVGAFVIFNTLSITVAQRTREFATLRTLGASRKQVMRSVIVEGLAVGLLASLIGLVLGVGISKGMIALFDSLGVELPEAETIVATRTITVSIFLGVSITLLASILPARRATRVPPIAAVREGSTLPPSKVAAHSHNAGIGVTAASLSAIIIGAFTNGLSGLLVGVLVAGGVLGLFAGIALLAPRLVKPLARFVGWPTRRFGGVAGDLAGANSVRNPGRTASTAAALMIGLTLVTIVAVLGASLNAGTQAAVKDQLHADYVVDGTDGLPFAAAGGDELAGLAGVTASTQVRSDEAVMDGTKNRLTGIDAGSISHFYRFNWTSGSQRTLAALGNDGAIVTKSYAADHDLSVGSDLRLLLPSGEKRTVVVRGIHNPPKAKPLLASVTISQSAFDAAFSNPKNSFTFLDADDDAGDAIEATVKGLPDATFHTGAAYPKDATKEMATVLAMLYVLLGFSIVVSLFGMVNTMVLSVFERTREVGMLRAIGMTRRQSRRMIRHESIITALIGAALGIGLGVFLSTVITQAVPDSTEMTIPWSSLVGFSLVAVIAGIGAAVMPARRASKLDVLEALRYQ